MHNVRILKNEDFRSALESYVARAESQVLLISAFLRSEILEWLGQIIPSNVSVRVLARWRPVDLISGASDLRAYNIARDYGWTLYVDEMVHAKTILVDETCLFVGSANLTARGTHFLGFGNNELTVQFKPEGEDVDVITGFFASALRVTQPLVSVMEDFLATIDVVDEQISWPKEIEECFVGQVESLWLDECFRTDPGGFFSGDSSDPDVAHDASIFGLRIPGKESFKRARVFGWLEHQFSKRPGEILSFGFLSNALHSSILDEDVPYRKEIKLLLANLFEWVEYFGVCD